MIIFSKLGAPPRRIRLLYLLFPLLLVAACDPQGPGAMGRLSLSPRTDLDRGLTLEIRMVRDDGEPFDPTIADLSVEYPIRRASISLSEVEFPFEYMVGGGLGTTEHEHWRVVAWIAESADVDRPKVGEYYGSREFDLVDCGIIFSKYCAVTLDVDLEIEAPETVAIALPSVEKVYGDYVVRCMSGDDPAASIGTYESEILTNGSVISKTRGDRDGEIQDCWMVNLDADDDAEIVLFSRVAGSGGYGQLYVYNFADDELQQTEIPEPGDSLMDGYQGRDLFEVVDGKLYRTFPIYLPSDPNCCPEGSDKTMVFDAVGNNWQAAADPTPNE